MGCRSIQYVIDIIRGKEIAAIKNRLKVYSKLRNKKNIPIVKVVGDSHTSFFSGHDIINFCHLKNGINNCRDDIENFITFHVGPALAYNLNRYNSSNKAREKIEYLLDKKYLKSGDTVLLCFGCIDTSVHLLKHIQGPDFNEGVKQASEIIINNYFEFIDKLQALGLKIYLWAALPQEKFVPEELDESIKRNKAVKIYNELLNIRAEKSDIKVLSVFDNLINEDFTMKQQYFLDGAHLNQKAWEFALDEVKKIDILKDFKIKDD